MGFAVLGFYSNDFGNQGGDPSTCNEQYKVTFPTFRLCLKPSPDCDDHVNTQDANGNPATPRPVFQWLIAQPNPGPAPAPNPDWNFAKYLISKKGQLVQHWLSFIWPGPNHANNDNDAVEKAIQAELAK